MTSGEYFDKQFNKIWDLVNMRVDDTPELRQIFYDSCLKSGSLVHERLVFVPIYGVKLSNYVNYCNFRYGELVQKDESLTKKDIRPLCSTEWKQMSVEERSKWSNASGTGEVQPKVNVKKSCSGYNLFSRDLAKKRRQEGGDVSQSLKKSSVAWNSLPQETKDEWNLKAREVDGVRLKHDRRKIIKRVSGYNLFIRHRSDELKSQGLNCNLIQIAGEWTKLNSDEKTHWNLVARQRTEEETAAAAAVAAAASSQ